MDNPFERRATEQVKSEEAFLAIVTPEPLTTYLVPTGQAGQLYDRLVVLIGTPGSGKTTIARVFEYPVLAVLLRDQDANRHRGLKVALSNCNAIADAQPRLLACRLPLESDYREIWEFPYSEEVKDGLLRGLIQARAILAWFRYLDASGASAKDVQVLPSERAHGALEAVGGVDGSRVVQKAREVEQEIYRVVGALVPPKLEDIGAPALQAYRPFDVIRAIRVPNVNGGDALELQPMVCLDDAHTLHPRQFRLLKQWLIKRELPVARWVLTRMDVLTPEEALASMEAGTRDEPELPGITKTRDILEIWLQNPADRGEQRRNFRRMAKDMADRYLRQMPLFRAQQLESLGALLGTAPDALSPTRTKDLEGRVNTEQQGLRISDERRKKLFTEVALFRPSGRDLLKDEQLAMLAILMHRYAKRIPQARLFEGELDPEPARALAVDSTVYEAARLHLLHQYGRPFFFGIDDLCDAGSENAEQFLRLAAVLVNAIATRLIRRHPPALSSKAQDDLLRTRATEFLNSWNFPHFDLVQGIVDQIAKRCINISVQPNAWIGAGANAYGIPHVEYKRLVRDAPDLARTLKYALAYNALVLVPQYECKNQIWSLFELGGIPILHYGLTLRRGGFVEGTLQELATYNKAVR